MSSYGYSLLPSDSDSIRLLRLLPSEDEAAPLHCELCNYSLLRPTLRTHIYEALSYVWGDPNQTLPIRVGKNQFQVTLNLHAALSRLRDHSFERIIWVDAICIDQSNNEERRQQVQLMAKIYSNAYCVIVWLGEQVVEVEGAFEIIRRAADNELAKELKEELNREAVINLLRNPWFQRIWVLQEAAAARNIVIMCGSTTIDGYTFCLGVKSLEFSYTASPELRTLPSVIYLIERAGLRPKITANMSGRFSLEIRSLAELIDMFHSRQATDPRDMVYALLGMSSEDPETTVIQPDYEISWEELFQQLVKSVLGKKMSMEISCQRPVIKCKGCVLGLVRSVERGDRQCVKFTCRNKVWGQIGDRREWTLQASANPIQKHDIICLLYGASKPSIIRLCKDHFVVVVIAATPLKKDWWSRSYEWISWPKLSQLTTQFLRDFLLIWDWGNFYEESQDHGDYKTLTKVYSQGLVSSKAESKEYFSEAARLWNDIEILDELEEYGKADERILEARRGYAAAFGKDSVPWEIYQHGRTLLSIAAGEGHKDITKLLLDTVDPDIKDGRFLRTPLCWAAIYGHEAVIKLLLETGKVEADSKDKWDRTPLWYASSIGHEAVVKLLLESGQVNPDSKDKWDETPLWCATDSGHEAIVKLLLETGEVDVNSRHEWGKTPLSQAADNENKAILKLFLETGKADVDSKDNLGKTLLSKAVDNGYEAIVKLLLETGKVDIDLKDMWGKSPLSRATDKGDEVIVKLLLEFRDQQSRSRLEGSMG